MEVTMNANTFFPLATIALLAAGIAQKAFSAADLEQNYEGVRYACAGVSQESRDDPRWSSYPLKLVFAAADGGFLGDVKVKIGDAKGDTVLQAHCLSPWLLVDLAPGSYKIEAMSGQDSQQSFPLSVDSRHQQERTTRFPEIAK
jgi:hypothetical protein